MSSTIPRRGRRWARIWGVLGLTVSFSYLANPSSFLILDFLVAEVVSRDTRECLLTFSLL
jgi:hypothetical protein